MERNKTLDISKTMAIFMVVWGHSLYLMSSRYYHENNLFNGNLVYQIIRCVQMPAFMVISGMLFFHTVRRYSFIGKPKEKTIIYRSCIRGIIIPTVLWCVLPYIGWKLLTANVTEINLPRIYGLLINKWWFFKALLFCRLMMSIYHYLFRDKIQALFLVVLGSIFLFDNNVFSMDLYTAMLPYFIIGYCISDINKLSSFLQKKLVVLTSAILFGFYICSGHIYGIMNEDMPLRYAVILERGGAITLILGIVFKMTGVLLMLMLCQKLSKLLSEKSNKLITKWAGNTMVVYPLHCLIAEYFSQSKLNSFCVIDNHAIATLWSLLVAIILFLFCNIVTDICKRSKWFEILFLGKITTSN